MKHTTHTMTEEQKLQILATYNDLIALIFFLNSMALRKQIKRLYHKLSGIDEMTIDFYIADLIQKGFLINLKVNGSSRTAMLYLSKWPRAQFEGKKSGDISSLCFSETKLKLQIFKVDYILDFVIPDLEKRGLPVTLDYINGYLIWQGNNLFLPSSQVNNAVFYQIFEDCCIQTGYSLTDYFYRDKEIAIYEKEAFLVSKSGQETDIGICTAKVQRDTEAASYHSDIEKNKQLYNLNNFAGQGFYFTGFDEQNPNTMNILLFDFNNNIQTKKIWQNLGFILMMMQRYTNNNDIVIHADIIVWDDLRKNHLQEEELKRAYDFYRQEWVDENKAYNILKNIGILPSNWENLTTCYIVDNLYERYNITYF